ncbi:protein hold'em [Calliphora vicina]|uniref:protein hold'em n=1 Tax=Calliphora vicina TaxID=7373 RepID=UPI00325C2695
MSNKPTENLSELTVKKLYNLHSEDVNTLIVALVLSKTEPNIFLAKNDTVYKGVMNFTLRDSKHHVVNCKCWGPREKIEEYNEKIKIADIVDVICCKVNSIKIEGPDTQQARYQPLATLPISLVLNDGQGFMEKHNFHDLENYKDLKQLWRLSHKPLYSVLNLADVKNSFRDAQAAAMHTDFLVVVALLRPLRELKAAKDGKLRKCLELVVFDQSLPSGMILTIWHLDWIERAKKLWQPLKTVLHLIDIKVSYSEFYKGCMLSFTSRSLIYENPMGQETQMLVEYAESMPKTPFEMLAQQSSDSLPKADQIQTIMTVRQIYTRAEGQLSDTNDQFTAVLYALISHINLDLQSFVLSKRCKSCQRLISWNKTLCEMEQCQMGLSFNFSEQSFEYFFNINLHLSDQTGTLMEARLTDKTAERVLKLNTEQYRLLNDKDLENLKWSFLMQHYEVKLLIKKPNMLRRKLIVIVVDMRAIDIDELSKYISAF